MDLNPRKPPPIEADIRELTNFIGIALCALQFCSDESGMLPLPVSKLLVDFLPEFKRRTSPLQFIERYLSTLGLISENETGSRVRLDVFEVRVEMVSRARPIETQPELDLNGEGDDIASDCHTALARLQTAATQLNEDFKQLKRSQLVVPVREIIDTDIPADIIRLLRKLDVYRVVVDDGEIKCLVEGKVRQLSLAMLEAGQPLVSWPANLLQPQPQAEVQTASVDDIVRGLIAAHNRCAAQLQAEQKKNLRLSRQLESLQRLPQRVQELEIALAILNHQLPDGRVQELLKERGIRFDEGR